MPGSKTRHCNQQRKGRGQRCECPRHAMTSRTSKWAPGIPRERTSRRHTQRRAGATDADSSAAKHPAPTLHGSWKPWARASCGRRALPHRRSGSSSRIRAKEAPRGAAVCTCAPGLRLRIQHVQYKSCRQGCGMARQERGQCNAREQGEPLLAVGSAFCLLSLRFFGHLLPHSRRPAGPLLCRRLDYALTEMKRKHDMPVKGWRPVAAIHNAKSERSREEHKEYMEQVAP
jgi:hypothetical protein